jgi:hypothetical protein
MNCTRYLHEISNASARWILQNAAGRWIVQNELGAQMLLVFSRIVATVDEKYSSG